MLKFTKIDDKWWRAWSGKLMFDLTLADRTWHARVLERRSYGSGDSVLAERRFDKEYEARCWLLQQRAHRALLGKVRA